MPHLGMATLLVPDYDEAIAYYRDVLGFVLLEDSPLGSGKRWVVMSPDSGRGAALLLARATGEQVGRVGQQTGGRVAFFLRSSDFSRDFERLDAAGVHFLETPREEAYGMVAVFEDLFGNRWDLVEDRPRRATAQVLLRPMSEQEYAVWAAQSLLTYARHRAANSRLPLEVELERVERERTQRWLPQGRGTPRTWLLRMRAAESLVMAAGGRAIGLNVFGDNEGARRLYERLGYTSVATVMRKELPVPQP